MATLTNAAISSSFGSLLKLNANDDTIAAGGSTAIQVKSGLDGDTPLYLNTNRLGINTASPAVMLDIRGTLNVGVDDTGHDVKFFGATSGSYMLWDESQDDLILGGAARLGIGTTTPAYPLQVSGSGAQQVSIVSTGSNGSAALLLESDGTGDPLIQFRNDSTTEYTIGVDASDSDKLKFANNTDGTTTSSTRMTLDASGYLGIGSSSPAAPLHVYHTSDNAPNIIFEHASATPTQGCNVLLRVKDTNSVVGDNTVIGDVAFQAWDGDADYYTSAMIRSSTEGATSNDSTPADLTFWTNPGATTVSQRMIIDKDGNVGIGATDPGVRTTSATGCSILEIAGTPDAADDSPVLVLRSLDTSIASNDTIGSIKAVGNDIYSTEEGLGAEIRFRSSGTWNGTTYDYPTSIAFFVNDGATGSSGAFSEVATITAGGKLGIGTTAPDLSLHVHSGSNHRQLKLDCDASYNAGFILAENDTMEWRIEHEASDSKLKIRDSSETVRETMIQSTNGWVGSSDERIKDNITDIGSVLSKIQSIRCVHYKDKYGSDKNIVHTGMIAQDFVSNFGDYVDIVQQGSDFKIIPETRDDNDNIITEESYTGEMSIGYSRISVILLKAIQELSTKVTALENA